MRGIDKTVSLVGFIFYSPPSISEDSPAICYLRGTLYAAATSIDILDPEKL
jgi:hypothetical protein